MDLYYQNETLYVDIMDALDTKDYNQMEAKIFRIIEDYGVSFVLKIAYYEKPDYDF